MSTFLIKIKQRRAPNGGSMRVGVILDRLRFVIVG
jgi:hypothetical protein